MHGGPVNGVPWTATLSPGDAAVTSALRRRTNPNDPLNSSGIIVPTMLQMGADALSYWTSMTCLYDRYWEPDPDRITLPICMFHVKKIVPTRAIEASKKRVILYEPQQDEKLDTKEMADQLRRGVIQTVIDNVVKQPTTYTMEIIVPFQPVGRYINEGAKTVSDMILALSDLFDGRLPDMFADWYEGIFSTVLSAAKTAGQAAEFAGKLPSINGVSFINMNSLEAMADSCRMLCMKMWTGYDYKYVLITGMTFEKQPTEDDVFRASLTLQEMPVLTIARSKSPKPATIDRNWAVAVVNAMSGAFVAPLIALTDVKKAAEDSSTVKEILDTIFGG